MSVPSVQNHKIHNKKYYTQTSQLSIKNRRAGLFRLVAHYIKQREFDIRKPLKSFGSELFFCIFIVENQKIKNNNHSQWQLQI